MTSPLHPHSSPRQNGFTLVELLVVIAIVAILATVGISVANKVLARGRETKCLENIRQIASQLNLYAAEHNSFYPPGGTPRGYVRRLCAGSLADSYLNTGTTQDESFFRNGSGKFFICPDNKSAKTDLTKSYLINGCIAGVATGSSSDADGNESNLQFGNFPPRAISSVSEPSRTFLVIEDHHNQTDKIWTGNDTRTAPVTIAPQANPHRGGSHYAFIDGHAEFYLTDPALESDDATTIHYKGNNPNS